MLSLDIQNSSLNPSAIRALQNARLAELKKKLAAYFGFANADDIASALAYAQVTRQTQARAPDGAASTSDRNPSKIADVQASVRDLDLRSDPAVAQIFQVLLDEGAGARKVLNGGEFGSASIKTLLENMLIGGNVSSTDPNSNTLSEKKHKIARCIKLHYCGEAGIPRPTVDNQQLNPLTKENQIFFDDLGKCLPLNQPTSGSNSDSSDYRSSIAAIRMEHPLLIPGEKNAEILSVFFNAMPTLEMTRATPVLNVTLFSSRQVVEGDRLAAITLNKFLEGAKTIGTPTSNNLPLRAMNSASQVPATIFGETGQDFDKYTVMGIELFRSPQTLINIEEAKRFDGNNRLAPVIDPMRPLASLKSFSVDIKSAYGLQGTRTATVELVLHDRSRLGEFADFVKPDRYGTSFLEVEYGWSHPDPLGVNPYADLLNLTRMRDHFNIVTSNFSFDEVGQVIINLTCLGRGSSEMTELSIIGEPSSTNIRQQMRELENLSRTINELSSRVFPQPPENQTGSSSAHRPEIRGQQALVAAGDAINNVVLSNELLTQMRRLQETLRSRVNAGDETMRTAATELQNRITQLVGNVTAQSRTPSDNSAIRRLQTSINNEIRNILNSINSNSANDHQHHYNDSFLATIDDDAWRMLFETSFSSADSGHTSSESVRGSLDNDHVDAVRDETVSNTQFATTATNTRSTGNNAANAGTRTPADNWTGKTVVSLGSLIMAFVAKPLAQLREPGTTTPKFEEVQVYFYNFNNKASLMSRCNISQFPVQTKYFIREYSRLRLENVSRTVNFSVSEFLNFVATKIVDDVMNPAYRISDLYRPNQRELTQSDPANFDSHMLKRMRRYNIGGSSDFVMPQITFDIEAVPAVIAQNREDTVGTMTPGRTILKIHIYDRTCSSNSSLRELLSLSSNSIMNTLSTFPGDSQNARTNEQNASQLGENVGVLRENWRNLYETVINRAVSRNLIQKINPKTLVLTAEQQQALQENRLGDQYRFVGGPQRLKEFVMQNVPHIIYGAMGSTIRSANLSSMSDPALNTIHMQRSLNMTPVQPNGEQAGGIPLTIYPVELTMTSMGCPFIRYGQEIFVDYGTNTTADNIYYVTGLTHKLEAGNFDTTIKFTAVDSFGQYRNLIGQLNTAATTLASMPATTTTAATTR